MDQLLHTKESYYQKSHILLFYVLVLFVVMRPVLSTSFFTTNEILGLKLREIFGIGISYTLIMIIFLSGFLKRFGLVEINILFFLFYAGLSVLWGSDVHELPRLMLPCVCFFAVRLAVDNRSKINLLLVFLFGGFLLPALGSSFLIMIGRSVSETVFWTGIERYSGVYWATHELAHEMFILITFACLYLSLRKETGKERTFFVYLVYFVSFFAILNLYKSYVRTVYLGMTTLVGFHFIGRKRYALIAAASLVLVAAFLYSGMGQTIFYDIVEAAKGTEDRIGLGLEGIGSGRIWIWKNQLANFADWPIERYFLGMGLGKGESLYGNTFFGASHNDLLSLLMGIGIIGLTLYLCILLVFFVDIVKCNLDRVLKCTFLGFLIAVLGMNLASNSYLSRFELGQYFFFTMGIFYALRDISKRSGKTETHFP